MLHSFNSQRDGILLKVADRIVVYLDVSIPNGMEFYHELVPVFLTITLFQFPTGWNSTLRFFYIFLIFFRFNSQRDGILLNRFELRAIQLLFQFPTGWNSTLCLKSILRGEIVSIPNGMEFYGKRLPYIPFTFLFQFPTGWNSTIRQKPATACLIVSIPNGMEFYLAVYAAVEAFLACFNSQRDGILPKWRAFECCFRSLFQFPTGWNSTKLVRFLLPLLLCFNSQRDGILPCRCRRFILALGVSIPNGMEFYRGIKIAALRTRLFQFPTGWNSTL